jgi:hypothetical protein
MPSGSVMNSLSHNCLFILSFFIFVSCTKSKNGTTVNGDTTAGATIDTTIYIAGDNGTNPILWKNGKADTLSPTIGSASQVTISGNDVYVAGVYQEIENFSSPGVLSGPITGQYVYWKNGIQNNIGPFRNIVNTSSISVAGNNVFYSDSSAWENGTMIALPGMASVRGIFTSGTDVYIAGYDSVQDVVYWKNGQLTVVSPFLGYGSTTPQVSCIYVSGNDVYLGGMYNQAAYWKNGIVNNLQYTTNTSFVSSINSMLVSGNDVYTPGGLIGVGLGPAYWKNGIENDLLINGTPNGNTTYVTTSVFLFGSDLYVSGYTSTFVPATTTYLDSAVCWKNGVEINLHSSGRASSIYVQQTSH